MIIYSNERKAAITAMKAFLKSHAESAEHRHYVLYAALRGQDVRKTSHQPLGDNALETLAVLKTLTNSYERRKNYFFSYLTLDNWEPIFKQSDVSWLREILEEAQTITQMTPNANDGITLLESRQHR